MKVKDAIVDAFTRKKELATRPKWTCRKISRTSVAVWLNKETANVRFGSQWVLACTCAVIAIAPGWRQLKNAGGSDCYAFGGGTRSRLCVVRGHC